MKPEQILREALLGLLPPPHTVHKDEWWCEKCVIRRRDYYSHHDNFFCERCGTKLNRREYEENEYDEWNAAREEMKKNIESLDLPALIERIANEIKK